MAHHTLPVLDRLPFPQTFTEAVNTEIRRVERVTREGLCAFQSPETRWGACDGGKPVCYEKATVSDPESGDGFCARHFDQLQAVTRSSDVPALQPQNPDNSLPKSERYFAVVIKADDRLGGILSASTNLGNYLRACENLVLPEGAKITRSIEITKDMATRTW